MAIAIRIPRMMMTTRSSMSVKPSSLFRRVRSLFSMYFRLLPRRRCKLVAGHVSTDRVDGLVPPFGGILRHSALR